MLGGHLAVIEPGAVDGRPLTVTILADQDCFDVAATRVDEGGLDTKPLGINKHLVLKQLIFHACDKAEDGTALTLMVRGKPLPATVVPMPFVPHRYAR